MTNPQKIVKILRLKAMKSRKKDKVAKKMADALTLLTVEMIKAANAGRSVMIELK